MRSVHSVDAETATISASRLIYRVLLSGNSSSYCEHYVLQHFLLTSLTKGYSDRVYPFDVAGQLPLVVGCDLPTIIHQALPPTYLLLYSENLQ